MVVTEYKVRPLGHICGLIFTGIMVVYPFIHVYGQGRLVVGHEGHCETVRGGWSFFDLSHLLLWGFLMSVLVVTYPKMLIRDEDEQLYRYLLLLAGQEIIIPYDHIVDVEAMGPAWANYVVITAQLMPFLVRPTMDARRFVQEHKAALARAKGFGDALQGPTVGGVTDYGSTRAAAVVAAAATASAAQAAAGVASSFTADTSSAAEPVPVPGGSPEPGASSPSPSPSPAAASGAVTSAAAVAGSTSAPAPAGPPAAGVAPASAAAPATVPAVAPSADPPAAPPVTETASPEGAQAARPTAGTEDESV